MHIDILVGQEELAGDDLSQHHAVAVFRRGRQRRQIQIAPVMVVGVHCSVLPKRNHRALFKSDTAAVL